MILATPARTDQLVLEVISSPIAYPRTYVNSVAPPSTTMSNFCNASRKHIHLAREKLNMQPQCCLHNIVMAYFPFLAAPNFSVEKLSKI
jgi:hypothetical protein